MTTFRGRSTPITRGARRLRSWRTASSSWAIDTMLFALATPMRLQKSRIASGVQPRRRSPTIVGMRGSSHPATRPSDTSSSSLRLLSTV